MKDPVLRSVLGGLILLLLLAGCVPAFDPVPSPTPLPTPTPTPTPAPRSGRVLDARTGAPLVGARVTWPEGETTTDGAGRYRVPHTVERIRVEVPGYAPLDAPAGGDLVLEPLPLTLRIRDAWQGVPLAGAQVRVDGTPVAEADDQGIVRLTPARHPVPLEVRAPGYAPLWQEVPLTRPLTLTLELRPRFLEGQVRDARTGAPVAGARVRVGETEGRSGPDGGYRLEPVPPAATLHVEAPGYLSATYPLSRTVRFDVLLEPRAVTVTVLGPEGPLPYARIATGDRAFWADEAGRIRLEGLAPGTPLMVRAPGFRGLDLTWGDELPSEVRLEPWQMKGIYWTSHTAGTPALREPLIALIERTELNAVVIDLKAVDGAVAYDSHLPLVDELGLESIRIADLPELLQDLKERGIYTVARIVALADGRLGPARPEWALHDVGGGLWRDRRGLTWLNPHEPAVAQYLADLAVEAARLGFDEVQLDYIRFPTDGPTGRIAYPIPETEETRTEAIAQILRTVDEALAPTGAMFSVDVFGMTTVAADDVQIGQRLDRIAPYVDYICPMVYPSHYAPWSFGHPNPAQAPYDVVYQSLTRGRAKVEGMRALLRPWLQDFDLGAVYGPAEVRAQIQATYDAGGWGWSLWNAGNRYTEGGLEPAPPEEGP